MAHEHVDDVAEFLGEVGDNDLKVIYVVLELAEMPFAGRFVVASEET